MRIIACFAGLLISASISAQQVNIIPKPAEMKVGKGNFIINKKIQIAYDSKIKKAAQFLEDYLTKFYKIKCEMTSDIHKEKSILLMSGSAGKEGSYTLDVDKVGISIEGDETGVFYGVQTLIQLLPVDNDKRKTINNKLQIPFVRINDYPRFSYRGMHLDVGRHFFPVSFVKKYIDYIALHKMNYFHWHLTEDQGWRIEIKKYPGLTQVGAWRNGTIIGRFPGTGNDGIRYGGFYTQEQIKEIVKYAAERYITVIPEIEMPGHCSAAIASYPWLSCFPNESTKHPPQCAWNGDTTGKQVQQTWGVFDDVYCAGKDSTFKFLQDVLEEVIALFPSKYIHVGGDECPKANWKRCPFCQKRMKDEGLKDEHELQSYFIQRMEKYLNSKGRTLIGWDEILEGGLAPNAMVMSWRGEEGGIAAARQKHKVIMTPGGWCYFDHSQSQDEDSVTIGSYTPVEKVYSYEPIPDSLTAEQGKYVLGAQGNVWTEYMGNERKVEYMIFPRMTALSEVLWTQKKKLDWKGFEKRLLVQLKRYDLWKVNYSKVYFDLKATVIPSNDYDGIYWKLESKNENDKIVYLDGTEDNATKNYTAPIRVFSFDSSNTYSATLENSSGHLVGYWVTQRFHFNKARGKKITLTNPPSQNYPGDGAFTLVNGVWNEKGLERSREFLGFEGTDCGAIIDLGTAQTISNIKVHIFQQTASWIWRPQYAEIFSSNDGTRFTSIDMTDNVSTTNGNGIMEKNFTPFAARYIKLVVKNWGTIPEGNPGAGNKPWLFVDEIEVN